MPNSGGFPTPEQPEFETVRPPLPVVQRLRLGKVAALGAKVEVAAGAATLLWHEPMFLVYGAFAFAGAVGGAIYGAHEHHVNGHPRSDQLFENLIKERQHPTIYG